MLSHAVKAMVPKGLMSLQASAACSFRLSLDAFQTSGSDRFHSEAGLPPQPDFHVPSLFSGSNNLSDERKQYQLPLGARGMGVKDLASARKALGLAPFSSNALSLSTFGSSRLFHAMAPRRPSLPIAKGLGPGLMSSKRSAVPSMIQTRAMTDGELLGASYLLTTDIMFWSGLIGAVVFRRNLIVMLLCTEILMLACNMNFLFASAYFNDMTGVIMSITITTIAACETAIGLALCVTYFHIRSATDVEALNLLK